MTAPQLKKSDAYWAGYAARDKGDRRNPYPPASPEHAEWIAGHNQRDDELAW